ncbi:MAG: trigger factor, partial [Rhodospirillales bacterium]|nr:trigger factor [Rhodospirillales bacterium]
MQVTETNTEGLKREFKVLVSANEIDEQVNSRLKEMAKTARLPGFRPGKAPVSLLKKKYGPSIMGEVLERTVNETTQKTLSERGLQAAMQPKIEITSFDAGKDLEYTMAVEILPEIKPIDFSKLKLEKLVAKADEKVIDETLERLASANKTSEPVSEKRKSKSGDILVIDFVGRVDGEEFAGGKAEAYALELGSGNFIPGFEDQLIGVSVGDHVDVKVKFPESYGAEQLAGKDATFEVDVKELRKPSPAPIDDDLAKKVGLEKLDQLKDSIREEHEREFSGISRQRLKRTLLDALINEVDFELPQGLLDNEFNAIWAKYDEERTKNPDALDPEDKSKSDDELKEEFRTISERRVRLGLFLAEIGRTNNLQVTQEDINRALSAEARRYPGQEQAVIDHYRNNPDAMDALTGPI